MTEGSKTQGTEALRVESLEATARALMPLTMLLKHLPMETVNSTVVTVTDTRCNTNELLIKYAGIVVHDANDEGEKKSAVARLLAHVDEHLFTGNPHEDGREAEIEGLIGFAHDEPPKNTTRRITVYEGREIFEDRAKFYARYEKDRENPGTVMRLFTPTHAQPIHEGELPASAPTYAIKYGALVWRQLLPMTCIQLMPMREGLITTPFRPGGEMTVTPQHENSREVMRAAIVMYGALELRDPDGVYMLRGK